jgi:hypothetical protein
MSPQELYSVAVRFLGLALTACSIAICLLPLVGILGPLFVGLTLLVGSRFFATITYGRARRNDWANWNS